MDEGLFKRVLEEHVKEFKNNILLELEKSHDLWFEDFGFPIFGSTSKDYHEQVYFQSYLESYSRKLINGILKEIIQSECLGTFYWPEFEYNGFYNGYTNIEYENEFDFEFIDRQSRIGYRYTYFNYDEIDSLLNKVNVESICLVIWKNKDDLGFAEFNDNRVKVILVWELFQELFYELKTEDVELLYNTFITTVTKSIEWAHSIISLVTIPGFTSLYLHKNRTKIIKDLEKEVKKLTSYYVYHKKYKNTESNSKKFLKDYELPQRFLDLDLAYTFVGTKDHAKCFMTSEYLYNYFKENPLFDYTPIVSGYIKSIEQLLHIICKGYNIAQGVKFSKNSLSLNDYTEYLSNNRDIFREDVRAEVNVIISCLNSYRIECRNNLFHKDSLKEWEKVDIIRNNTIFLYVALLGTIDMGIFGKDSNVFGILNSEYDSMFYSIEKNTNEYFSLKFNDKEYPIMRKEQRIQGLSFGKYGLINNTIKFQILDGDSNEEIELSRKYMPTEVWAVDAFGKKKKRIF